MKRLIAAILAFAVVVVVGYWWLQKCGGGYSSVEPLHFANNGEFYGLRVNLKPSGCTGQRWFVDINATPLTPGIGRPDLSIPLYVRDGVLFEMWPVSKIGQDGVEKPRTFMSGGSAWVVAGLPVRHQEPYTLYVSKDGEWARSVLGDKEFAEVAAIRAAAYVELARWLEP